MSDEALQAREVAQERADLTQVTQIVYRRRAATGGWRYIVAAFSDAIGNVEEVETVHPAEAQS